MKRVVLGRPLRREDLDAQRLTKPAGLAVFGPDAISNSAFGAEALLRVLVPVAGMAALGYVVPLTAAVLALLALVGLSYAQMIGAYPAGGGTYAVCRERLGPTVAQVAGASLLVDYVLTVAVSIAVAADAAASAVAGLRGHETLMCVGVIAVLTIVNLRGIRESKRVASGPAYVYLAILVTLVVWGLVRSATGSLGRLPVDDGQLRAATGGRLLAGITTLTLLHAFAAGTVALSGVEAISNGVPSFRPPEARNARLTMAWTVGLLGSTLLGVAVLVERLRPTFSHTEIVLSSLGAAVFGRGSLLYLLLQAATATILLFAANTGFSDFPRLASVIAGDGLLPRQLAERGRRLVFSKAIVVLAGLATALVVGFGSDVGVLAALWAVALLLTFTTAQLGMAAHQAHSRGGAWKVLLAVNLVGAAATTVALVVLMLTSFTDGAWLLAVVIPGLVVVFRAMTRHHRRG